MYGFAAMNIKRSLWPFFVSFLKLNNTVSFWRGAATVYLSWSMTCRVQCKIRTLRKWNLPRSLWRIQLSVSCNSVTSEKPKTRTPFKKKKKKQDEESLRWTFANSFLILSLSGRDIVFCWEEKKDMIIIYGHFFCYHRQGTYGIVCTKENIYF